MTQDLLSPDALERAQTALADLSMNCLERSFLDQTEFGVPMRDQLRAALVTWCITADRELGKADARWMMLDVLDEARSYYGGTP